MLGALRGTDTGAFTGVTKKGMCKSNAHAFFVTGLTPRMQKILWSA